MLVLSVLWDTVVYQHLVACMRAFLSCWLLCLGSLGLLSVLTFVLSVIGVSYTVIRLSPSYCCRAILLSKCIFRSWLLFSRVGGRLGARRGFVAGSYALVSGAMYPLGLYSSVVRSLFSQFHPHILNTLGHVIRLREPFHMVRCCNMFRDLGVSRSLSQSTQIYCAELNVSNYKCIIVTSMKL